MMGYIMATDAQLNHKQMYRKTMAYGGARGAVGRGQTSHKQLFVCNSDYAYANSSL